MTSGLRLSYLLAHPTALGLTAHRPVALLLLVCLPLFFVLTRNDGGRHRSALGLRLAAFALLVCAIAGVAVTALLPSNKLSLIAAVDVSESMGSEGRQWARRYLDRVAAALAPGDEMGVVTFAKHATVALPPGALRRLEWPDAALPGSATDIGQGIETAMALFAPDAEHRLLLISDGNETRGSSLTKVALARQSAARIYVAVPPHEVAADVAVEKLSVPPLVAEGQVFPLRAALRNAGGSRPVTISLLVDKQPADTQQVMLQQGLNAVDIPYRLSGAGSHRLRLQVAAVGDAIAGNNYREANVTVSGKTRVLLVSARTQSPLASVLARKSIGVTEMRAGDFPEQTDALAGYHCVLFEDVTANAFSTRQFDALERYVKDFGGGFIMAGGERTYNDAGFTKTALERLLPVTLEPRRPAHPEPEPLALFILIDRSNSMGYQIHSQLTWSEEESKLAYAKRAALAVIRQLKDTDLVGVMAFDFQPFQVAPFGSLQDIRTVLEQNIPRLHPGGGTDFYDALEAARLQLIAAHTGTKHVILLTDGATIREPAAHAALIAALAEAHISVTTIRIGNDKVDLNLLRDIAVRTAGQFYHVENAAVLPDLLVKDTVQAAPQTPPHDETFTPRVASVSQVLRGIHDNELPNIRGYAYARSKPGADVLLSLSSQGKKDPLLGAWQYGLGRVIALTASPLDDADAWIGWPGFGKFWSQLVHWSVRDETPWDYAVDVHRTDGQVVITIHSFDDMDDGLLMARLFSDPDHATDIALTPRAPREFTGRLPALAGGRYPLTITKRNGTRDVSQRTQVVTVPDTDEEPQEEFESSQPNLALLSALTAATGGTVDPPIGTITERPLGSKRSVQPLDWLFIPAAMLLFLADVAIRRLRRPA